MSGGDSGYGASQNPSSPYGTSAAEDGAYGPSSGATGSYGDSSGGYSSFNDPKKEQSNSSVAAKTYAMFGNGVNLQPSYQARGDVDLGWHLLKQIAPVQTVRLEIEDFAVDAAARWIYEATSRGYKVIATYHNHAAIDNKPASDDPMHMQLAIQFWNDNYKRLAAAGPFVINIMNEWGHKTTNGKFYADQYNIAIGKIRAYYDGPLIIDLPGSGQLVQVAVDAVTGAGGISPILDQNIILSAHIYPKTWNGKRPLKPDDLDLLRATRCPCIIGEFGETNETPDTDWRAIVSYAKSLQWAVLAWSWGGDGGIMNMMLPEFQRFEPGKPNANYYLNGAYVNIVLPYLA